MKTPNRRVSLVAAGLLLVICGPLDAQDLFVPVGVDMPLAAGGNRELIDTGFEATLHAVAFGNNKYVAVGEAGTILYSDDLRSWTQAETSMVSNLQGIAFGHGRFVAVGDDALLLSGDGMTWESHRMGARGGLRTVGFGGGLFVALTNDTYTLVSEDGMVWTAHELVFARDFRHIVYGGGMFIAGGLFTGMYSSPDGVAWTGIPSTYPTFGLTYGAGRWVRGTYTDRIEISDDGETWTAVFVPGMRRVRAAYANDAFVAVAAITKSLAVSGDGERWPRRFAGDPFSNTEIRDLFSLNNRLVAPFVDGQLYVYEGDRPSRIVAMAEAEGRTYALDSLGRVVAESEGGWATVLDAILPDPLALAVLGPDKIAIVGGAGEAAFYEDGQLRRLKVPSHQYPDVPEDVEDESLPSPRVYRFLSGIAHDGENRFVTVGANATAAYADLLAGVPAVWIRAAAADVRTERTLRDIAYGNGRYVAAGYDGTILYSFDGEIWQEATARLEDSLAGIAFGMGRFVVVGKGGVILVSEDGETWYRHSLNEPHALTSVSASAHGFLIGGWDGRVFRSRDARAWEEIDLGTTLSVTAVGGTFAGLSDGTILEIKMAPIVPRPTNEGFFSRLGQPGGDLLLTFPTPTSKEPMAYSWNKDGVPIPGATSLSLELQGLTWEDAGSYRLAATSAGGTTFSDPITVALPFDYEAWLVERSPFTEEELADPEITAPLATPFGDGITNLERYGFGMRNPGNLSGLPRVGIETIHGYGFQERYLTVTFSRPLGASDISFGLERSRDLSVWEEVADSDVASSIVRGSTEWITLRDKEPIYRETRSLPPGHYGFEKTAPQKVQESERFLRVRLLGELGGQ